jgi:hypothetical protein
MTDEGFLVVFDVFENSSTDVAIFDMRNYENSAR